MTTPFYSELVSRGMPQHIAAAFEVNAKDESGLRTDINEIKPLVPGSRGGYGLLQWTGPRRRQLEAFAAQSGKPVSDMGVQVDFLINELNGSEKRAARKIFAANNTADAAVAVMNDFLRPHKDHRPKREVRYRQMFAQNAQAGPSREEMMEEARRRGLIPADGQQAGPTREEMMEEARRRGLLNAESPQNSDLNSQAGRIRQEGVNPQDRVDVNAALSQLDQEDRKQNLVAGAYDQAADGLMGGFSDNVGAAMDVGFDVLLETLNLKEDAPEAQTLRERYSEAFQKRSGRLREFAKDNPEVAIPAQIGGALVTGAGMVQGGATLLKGATSLPSALGRSAVEGSIYGAIYGAGAADGENVGEGAVAGAATGAAVGLAAPLAISAFRQIPVATRTMANLIGVGSADKKAAALVAKALADDGPLSMTVLNAPDTLMDLAGASTRRLAGTARSIPSRGSSALEEMLERRVQTQGGRIAQDTLEFLGSTGDNYFKSVQEVIARRAAAAKPLYDKLNQQSMPITEDLAKLMDRPSMRAAVARAAKSVEDLTGEAVSLDANRISFMFADQIKKQLDKMARYGKTPQGAADGFDTAAVKSLTKQYLRVVDNHFPRYAEARKIYQSDAQLLDALEDGRAFIKGDADEMIAGFKSLPQAEKEAFRIGVARQLKDMVERSRDSHDAAAKIWATPAMRKRLKAVAPDKSAFGNYIRRLRRETQFTKTRNEVMGGSQTQPRQVAATEAAQDALNIASGNPFGILSALQRIGSRAQGMDQATASKVADLLSSNDPAAALRFIRSQEGTWLIRNNAKALQPYLSSMQGAATAAGAGQLGAGASRLLTGQ